MMTPSDLVQLHAVISGRVQGVGFRHFVVMKTQNTSITGWVRNTLRGEVEILAEGPQDQLVIILQCLHTGPPAAHVIKVENTWREATGEYQRFDVRRTSWT